MNFGQYLSDHAFELYVAVLEHIGITAASIVCAILIGVPLGILICNVKYTDKPVLGFANIIQAIPSIAFIGLMIPLLHSGNGPAVFIITLYALLPIIKNTYTGLKNISPDIIEVSKGIGLNGFQRLFRVQLPLALPVILAGIRISAVTSVGLVTLAYYIGGGGLGEIIIKGITNSHNSAVLAGSILACLLALLVDLFFALLEKLIVPKGIVPKNKKDTPKKLKAKGIMRLTSLILLIVILCISLIVPAAIRPHYDLKFASKRSLEPDLIGNIYADYIEEKTDLLIERNSSASNAKLLNISLQDDVDMSIFYSGSIYAEVLEKTMDSTTSLETITEDVRKFMEKQNVKTLNHLKFNNTYVLACKPEFAKKHNLKTISDLAALSYSMNLKLASSEYFISETRTDTFQYLSKFYGFSNKVSVDSSSENLRYKKEYDFIDAYATDGLLFENNLVTLEDDLGFFPKYNMIPVITEKAANEHPKLVGIMEELNEYLTLDAMIQMNKKVSVEKQSIKKVAHEFVMSVIAEQNKNKK